MRLIETPEAGHVTSWNVDTVRYATTLTAFPREERTRHYRGDGRRYGEELSSDIIDQIYAGN